MISRDGGGLSNPTLEKCHVRRLVGLCFRKKVTRVTVVTMVEVDRVPMVNMDTITRDTMVEVTTVAVTMVIVLAHRAKKLALRANNLESGSGGA